MRDPSSDNGYVFIQVFFVADYFDEAVASEIQLNAEYFPSPKIYGDAAVSNSKVSKYIKKAVE